MSTECSDRSCRALTTATESAGGASAETLHDAASSRVPSAVRRYSWPVSIGNTRVSAATAISEISRGSRRVETYTNRRARPERSRDRASRTAARTGPSASARGWNNRGDWRGSGATDSRLSTPITSPPTDNGTAISDETPLTISTYAGSAARSGTYWIRPLRIARPTIPSLIGSPSGVIAKPRLAACHSRPCSATRATTNARSSSSCKAPTAPRRASSGELAASIASIAARHAAAMRVGSSGKNDGRPLDGSRANSMSNHRHSR